MSEIISGVIPVVPTVFGEDEQLDLDGQRRVLDYLIDGGCDAVCILANYSEQFSLDDAERDQVMATTLEHAAGRIPVVVTTSHYGVGVARSRVKAAADAGAAMVMLMPPFFGATMRVDEADVVDYFLRVSDGIDIDIMIQDAPLSTTALSVGLIARLAAEVPRLRYAKIEMQRSAPKIRAILATAGDDLPGVFDGEEGVTLIPDLHAGVRGTMSSAMVPDELGLIVRQFHAGEVAEATAAWERLLPLIHFENRQCGLTAAKVLLEEGGVIASSRTRSPFPGLPPESRRELVELARSRDPLVLRWAR